MTIKLSRGKVIKKRQNQKFAPIFGGLPADISSNFQYFKVFLEGHFSHLFSRQFSPVVR